MLVDEREREFGMMRFEVGLNETSPICGSRRLRYSRLKVSYGLIGTGGLQEKLAGVLLRRGIVGELRVECDGFAGFAGCFVIGGEFE